MLLYTLLLVGLCWVWPGPTFGAHVCPDCNTLNVMQYTVRCSGLYFRIAGNYYGYARFRVCMQAEPESNVFLSGHRTSIGKVVMPPNVARVWCAVDKRALCRQRVEASNLNAHSIELCNRSCCSAAEDWTRSGAVKWILLSAWFLKLLEAN